MARPANPTLARSVAFLAPVEESRDATAHDVALGARRPSPPIAEGIAFLAHCGFPVALLASVTARALRQGASAEDVLIREGHCTADTFYRHLAGAAGLPFTDRFAVLRTPPRHVLARCEVAHVEGDGFDYVVAPRGPQIANLLAPRGRNLAATHRLAVTTPARLTGASLQAAGETVACRAAEAPLGQDVQWSARHHPSRAQKVAMGVLALAVTGLVLTAEDAAWLALSLALSACFILQGMLRILAVTRHADAVLAGRVRPLREDQLPLYTILVPLYREARVLPDLVEALRDLDYPPAKLDIKLLVEAGDDETRLAALRLDLQPPFELVVCPAGTPRTKPRALNIGLELARDGLLVVYDAEDRPDRDQLRLAAAQFAACAGSVACLQASLAIDNAEETWLTRQFAIEYAQLFDVILPGLASLGLPIPLGGTSNHFRTEALRAAGGWDAWNVTEDADLGLRLARLGYKVERLDSTTWEEAPVSVRPWLRQRTRWLKGWQQTSLVHGLCWRSPSDPMGLLPRAALVAHTVGVVVATLGWPVFTASVVWHAATGRLLSASTWSRAVMAVLEPGVAVLGLAVILWPWALGAALRRIRLTLADTALLLVYLLLGSCAGWCALAELVHAPFRWAKTEHGLARRRRDRRRAGAVPGG